MAKPLQTLVPPGRRWVLRWAPCGSTRPRGVTFLPSLPSAEPGCAAGTPSSLPKAHSPSLTRHSQRL